MCRGAFAYDVSINRKWVALGIFDVVSNACRTSQRPSCERPPGTPVMVAGGSW